MTRIFGNIALFLMTLAVVVAVAEGGLRLVGRFDPANRLRFDSGRADAPPLGRPGTYRHVSKDGDFDVQVIVNQLGLRDGKALSPKAPPGLFALGDSFTMGFGVKREARYSNRLQDRFGQPVYNVALPGDLRSYRLLLAYARAKGGRPTGLIVGLCVENDVRPYTDAELGPTPTLPPGFGPRDARVEETGWKTWLNRRSALYLLASEAVHRTPWLAEAARGLGLIGEGVGRLVPAEASPRALNDTVAMAARLADDAGVPTVFVIIPSRKLWVGEERAEADATHHKLVAALKAEGLAVVDPRAAFEADGAPTRHLFPSDGHWNASGHAIAAEEIAVWIEAHDFPGHDVPGPGSMP